MISERSEQKWGSGGLPLGKFFMPFRSLENAPTLENVLLTEAKDHESCMTSKDIAFLIDSGSSLEYIQI